MSYVRASVNLTLDKPNADGRLTTWGIGRDWPAAEPRETGGQGYAADLIGTSVWEYQKQFEYLDKLRAVAPLGTYTEADVVLADWTVRQGLWRVVSSGGPLKHAHLHYYDGAAGRFAANAWGILRSNAAFTCNFEAHIWRFPPNGADTDPAMVWLYLIGDGAAPEYVIVLPGERDSSAVTAAAGPSAHPQLWGKPQGGTWAIIDEYRGGGIQQVPATQAVWQAVRVEYTAGWLLVRFSGEKECWAYSGPWRDAAGTTRNFALVSGPLEVQVMGHTAMFNVGQLAYPASADLYPSAVLIPGALVNVEKTYRWISSEPAGADISVASNGIAGGTRPKVTFTGGAVRAALFNVQEYRAPVFGDVSTDPIVSQGHADFAVKAISWELNSKWRGARLSATLKARPGQTLPTFYANCKVTATVGLEADPVGIGYPVFAGYHTPLESVVETGSLGRVQYELSAADWIESRAKHKVMYGHCSYEGFPIATAFRHILNRAGVPDALISIDAAVTGNLPIPNPPGDRGLQFRPDEGVVSALDKLASVCGLCWGVNQNGVVFLKPPYAHVAGHYDFTIDDTTQEAAHFKSFRRVRGTEEYFNVLTALVGEGWTSAGRQYVDLASMETPGSESYMGEDWWRFEGNPDASDVDLAMNRCWDSRNDGADLIYVRLQDHPELLPDLELRVRVSDCGVTQNSIYRILRHSGRISDPEGTARLDLELEAAKVEEGVPDA